MTCQVILDMPVKTDCVDKIQEWMKSNLPDTRGFEGFVSLNVTLNQDDPQNIVIVEQWDTRKHYEDYIAWRTERGDMDILATMMAGEPSFRFFDYLGV